MVRQLERDLPELLAFFRFPPSLWKKLRTTNVIERVFVEVRRAQHSAHGLLCQLWTASTGSSTPSFTASTSNGETALSRFIHMPLDITRVKNIVA
jgi:hypothetical protein